MRLLPFIAIILPCHIASAQLLSVDLVPDKHQVAIGESLELNVYVTDLRPESSGIVSAYLDLIYDETLLEVIPNSFLFGPSFGALGTSDLSRPGIIDEAGSLAAGVLSMPPFPSGVGGHSELLYSIRWEPTATGTATFRTGHPDNLPKNATTLLGIDDGLTESQIRYGSLTVQIVPEPGTSPVLLTALACIGVWRRRISRRPRNFKGVSQGV